MSEATEHDPAPVGPHDPHRLVWHDALRSDLARFLRKPSPCIGETEAELLADTALARVTRLRPDLVGTGEGRAVAFATARNLRLDLLATWNGCPPGNLPDHLAAPPALHDAEAGAGPAGFEPPQLQEFWVELEPMLGSTERAVLAALRRGETNTARIAAACNFSQRSVQRARRALAQKLALARRAVEEKLSPGQLWGRTGAPPSGGRGRTRTKGQGTRGKGQGARTGNDSRGGDDHMKLSLRAALLLCIGLLCSFHFRPSADALPTGPTGASVDDDDASLTRSVGRSPDVALSRLVPVLLIIGACQCPAQVTGRYMSGATAVCGNPPTPCFAITYDDNGDEESHPGRCFIPGNDQVYPPIPPPCPDPASACSFSAQQVTIQVASCAAQSGSGCGVGPWQAIDSNGNPSGQTISINDTVKVTVTMGNLPCKSHADHFVKVKDTNGNDIATYRVRSVCNKCANDPANYTPPDPQ